MKVETLMDQEAGAELQASLLDGGSSHEREQCVLQEDRAHIEDGDTEDSYQQSEVITVLEDDGLQEGSIQMGECPTENEEPEEYVAISEYSATDETQLTFLQGDKLLVYKIVTSDWLWAELNGHQGYVPANHIRKTSEKAEEPQDVWQDVEYFGSYGTLVYAVEASEIAQYTEQLVAHNGLQDLITVFQQKVEDVILPEKVDVLISEWMGTCLVFEFMIESVIHARERWLKEDGMMWPSTATLHLCPCSAARDYESKILFWENPYQLDLSPLKLVAMEEFFSKPTCNHKVEVEDCLAEPCDVLCLDMKSLQVAHLERMTGKFFFRVIKAGTLHGFLSWFSVEFQSLQQEEQKLELNTGPHQPATHWKQALFMFDEPVEVHVGDIVSGSILIQRNPLWRRHMRVTLNCTITGGGQTEPMRVVEKVFLIWK
ncbi:protein arginine N-methyltransferase 2 isoform X3 [Ambystoma mexicanum]|uniref:protein arginine N-methyltransferase 2 isoform X3 n=1 Tax=Ambystoma mexicanum TaxID=8296 RepID=UPI0037E7459C